MSWNLMEKSAGAVVLGNGKFMLRLEAYGENIIRVTQTGREAFLLNNEPMITASPAGALKAEECECCVSVDAGVLSCRLNRETGALKWLAGGEVVMREPEKAGRVMRDIDIIRHKFDPDAPMEEYQSVDGMRARVAGTPYVDRKGYQTKLSFVFDADEDIYGLGQHEEGMLNYRGQHQFLYQHNLKIASPVIYSSKGWALLNNCCGAQIFHDDAFGSYLSADAADEMDYFVIYGPEFDALVGGLRLLSGDSPMLPRWTMGYVQSKEHYHTQQELIDIAAEYRRRNVPIDCVVQDWTTWPQGLWGQKTTDPERYPDVKGAIDSLHDMNVKLMWSIWPNMNGDGANRREFMEKGLLLGNRSTYNAFEPEARKIYWNQCNEQLFPAGMDAWWCDCTEPFEGDWSGEVVMLPEDRMMFNVNEFKRYLDPAQILAYSIHHSATLYEGWRSTSEEKRVVNLTRSGLTGQQRYSTICWNGDTSATWETLRRTIPDGLNMALTGIPYWTVDAGAFFVKEWKQWFGYGEYPKGCEDEAYRELYVRWLQLGAFLPMMRSHGTDTPREIWRFGEKGEPYYDAIEKAIRLRYRLLPYIYSEMAAVHFERGTLMRMLAFDFRTDKIARNVKDQFMLGRSLMVAPIINPAKDGVSERTVYLPAGCGWYDFFTGERYEGGQTITVRAAIDGIPLFVREGSVLPLGFDVQYADEKGGAAEEIRVYPGADGCFTLYNDAGDGYGYEKGEYLRTVYTWNDAEGRLNASCEGDKRFAQAEPSITVVGR